MISVLIESLIAVQASGWYYGNDHSPYSPTQSRSPA